MKYAKIEIDEMQQEILVMALGRFENDVLEAEQILKVSTKSLALKSIHRMQEATEDLIEQVMCPLKGELK